MPCAERATMRAGDKRVCPFFAFHLTNIGLKNFPTVCRRILRGRTVILRMRDLMTNQLAPSIEKELERGASRKAGIRPDKLIAAAGGDSMRLADALWTLVREGKGGIVGQDRAVLPLLEKGSFDAQDFLSLLRQLKGANLYWFEHWEEEISGLAYHGWSTELERLLDKLLAKNIDRTPLEWADVSEPAGSSLLFALSRRGLVDAQLLPPGAISRFGRAVMWRLSWCNDQFAGWETLWPPAAWAKAAFTMLDEVPFICLPTDTLRRFIEYATPAQLALIADKLLMKEPEAMTWLASRGRVMVPHLEARMSILLQQAKRGEHLADRLGLHAGALARLRLANKETWPSIWIPVAKAMLEQSAPGIRDVLLAVDPVIREKLLLDLVSNDEHWAHRLNPLTLFPTTNLVQAVVQGIRNGVESKSWGWAPLFETLGNMGPEGQTALERLLHDPALTSDVLVNLARTPENALRTMTLLESQDFDIERHAAELWFELKNEERISLIAEHFDEFPAPFIARVLGRTYFHPLAASLAERLPDAPETHKYRQLCLSPPEGLRSIIAAMKTTPHEAISRAEQALAPLFKKSKSRYDEDEQDDDFDLVMTLKAFGADDLPAICHATAFRFEHNLDALRALCRHFAPVCPEIPWIAVFWWTMDSSSMVREAGELLGEAIMPALRERLKMGLVASSDWHDVLPIFAKFDPLFGFDYAAAIAGNSLWFLYVKAAFVAALEKDRTRVSEWLAATLVGKEREFALRFLREVAVPELIPNLEALQNQKLPIKLKKILVGAMEAQGTRGATITRSQEKLSARLLRTLSGHIQALQITPDGRTLMARTEKAMTVWQGETSFTLDVEKKALVELTPDGRFLLVGQDKEVRVFEPWTSGKEVLRTFETQENLTAIAPISGQEVFTLCFGQEHRGALTLWNVETGMSEPHRLNGFPAKLHSFQDGRYVVATKDELVSIRAIDGGKVLGKLQTWSHYGCGGTCALGVGNAGKLVAILFFDGGLMLWDISGPKVKHLGAHVQAAPRALVTDPFSTWVVTPSIHEVKTWKDGQPARSLEGSGAPEVHRDELFAEAGLAVFIRAGIVAVGGQSVDLWDLAASRHLGRWDKPMTTMATAQGKLIVGDARGNIWDISDG